MAITPAIIHGFGSDNQSLSNLQRIPLDSPSYNEDLLQNLIHNHPQLIPAGEIESSFDEIIPIARELSLPSGYLDNLYMTPDGYPVLVEVKLWKNQESRRKVVAQILEYAKDFASLKYEVLNAEIRKIRKTEVLGDNPLYEITSAASARSIDEITFIDRVTRNMREGRFLLLIVGDGIREDMENLANYLLHHSLRYAFGIVQIKLYNAPDGSVIAIPDVMAKTQTIERHVTVVSTQGSDMMVREAPAQIVTEKTERTSISLEGFYEAMTKSAPESVTWLKSFVDSLSDLEVELQVGSNGTNLLLKAKLGNGDYVTLILICPPYVEFWGLPNNLRKTPNGQIVARDFLDTIVTLIPTLEIKTFETGGMDIKLNGGKVPLALLHSKEAELKDAMHKAIQQTADIEEQD